MLAVPKPHMLRRRRNKLMPILVPRHAAQLHEAADVEFAGFRKDGGIVYFVVGHHDAAVGREGDAVRESYG